MVLAFQVHNSRSQLNRAHEARESKIHVRIRCNVRNVLSLIHTEQKRNRTFWNFFFFLFRLFFDQFRFHIRFFGVNRP